MALQYNWNADIPDKIISIMSKFTYKKEEYTYEDIDDSLAKIVEVGHMPTLIRHFYYCNSCVRALAIYLQTYIRQNSQSAPFPFEYEKMYSELMNRAKNNPMANPFFVTPLPYFDVKRYANK